MEGTSNSTIIRLNEDTKSLIHFIDKSEKSDFYFLIAGPQLLSKISYFTIKYSPVDSHTLSPKEYIVDFDDVKSYFQGWVNLLKQYNEISLTQEDEFAKIREEQFYDYFEIVEDDAANSPLDIDKQYKAYIALSNLKQVLLNSPLDSDTKQLVEEIEILEKDIPISTKKDIAKKICEDLF